jgi:hypothetical protein
MADRLKITKINLFQKLRMLAVRIDICSFFILFYLYLWLDTDLRLIYHGGWVSLGFPVFYRGWSFFRETVFYPGGLVEYVSTFLAQFFCIRWVGPLFVTVQAWLIWLFCSSILKVASERRLKWVCFVPPIVLLGCYTRYSYPFGVAMVFLVALAFVRLYMMLTSKKRPTDILVFLCLLIILYAIGDEGYLLFAVVCGIYEMLFRRRLLLGLVLLLVSPMSVHMEGVVVFDFGIIHAFDHFMLRSYGNKDVLIVFYLLYSLLPVTLFILWIGELLLKGKGTGRLGQFLLSCGGKAGGRLSPLLGIVAGVVVAYFCHSAGTKAQIAVSYYSCNKMWREVLEVYARYPHDKLMNHTANRALYHTGRLTQDMFVYGQHSNGLILSSKRKPLVPIWWREFDTYIDLGYINLAEFMLVHSIETFGERPLFLKRLALVNMVKGNTGAARVYLGALSKTLFDSDWAGSYLEKIETDPNLSTDKEVQHLRSIMPEIDRIYQPLSDSMFLDLLDKNKGNRMAFEYLAAYYLLTNQLDKFTGIMGRLNDFNYIRIPRVYEEAILLYRFSGKKVELGGRVISRESQERFNRFYTIYFVQYGKDKKAAFGKLASDYGDSFLFYSLYGRSGMKK